MTSNPSQSPEREVSNEAMAWYRGVNSHQWLVLVIASAGWMFGVYDGRIFEITRVSLLQSFGIPAGAHEVARWSDIFLKIFLAGGAAGGVILGAFADKWGRKPALAAAILVYSLFSGLACFAQSLWQVGALRFLVGMGVGGEWAVAASLVAEVFPGMARPYASGIFHSAGFLGIWLAMFAGKIAEPRWRYAYLLGLLPALLAAWVISSIKEPREWIERREQGVERKPRWASVLELLTDRRWRGRAFGGMVLAAAGLGTYGAVHLAGLDFARYFMVKNGVARAVAAEKAKSAYGIFEMAGGLAGLLCFGPVCARLGPKRAFALAQAAAFLIVPITCYLPRTCEQLLCFLPVFGFLTLGMHAGYAIYFPELFPAHLRAAGAGFCFGAGGLVAVPVLVFAGNLKTQMNLRLALSFLGGLFLVGALAVLFLPETRKR